MLLIFWLNILVTSYTKPSVYTNQLNNIELGQVRFSIVKFPLSIKRNGSQHLFLIFWMNNVVTSCTKPFACTNNWILLYLVRLGQTEYSKISSVSLKRNAVQHLFSKFRLNILVTPCPKPERPFPLYNFRILFFPAFYHIKCCKNTHPSFHLSPALFFPPNTLYSCSFCVLINSIFSELKRVPQWTVLKR